MIPEELFKEEAIENNVGLGNPDLVDPEEDNLDKYTI